VAETLTNCVSVLAIGDSFSYPAVILIGVTCMSSILYTLTVTQHSAPAGVAFGTPNTGGADATRDHNMSVLAARGAG
jgi:hypothetical protein